MLNKVMNFLRDEEGASAVEYALIAGLIAAVIIAALAALSPSVENLFKYIATKLDAAHGS